MTIIFQHIPKTAGNSIREFFVSNLSSKKVIEVLRDGRASIDINIHSEMHCICGHFLRSEVDSFISPRSVGVFLRDPVSRVISSYNFNRYNLGDFDDSEIVQLCVKNSLNDIFLKFNSTECVRDNFFNLQARYITGLTHSELESMEIDDFEVLVNAILYKYDWLGLVEKMQESFNLLSIFYGFPYNDSNFKHNSSSRSLGEEIDHFLISKYNKFDLILYQLAANRFDDLYTSSVKKIITKNYLLDEYLSASEIRSLDLKMSSPIPGVGWYSPEYDSKFGSYRWIGYLGYASFSVKLNSYIKYKVTVRVVNCINDKVLTGLRLRVNNIDVIYSVVYEDGWIDLLFDCPVVGQYSDGISTIEFFIKDTRPPIEEDSRELGIAISLISFKDVIHG